MAPPLDINLMYVRAQLAKGRTQKDLADELGVPPSVISTLTRYGYQSPENIHIGTEPLAYHPLADYLPLIEGPAFEALVADIASQGQLEPLTLHEGQILDGRNRYRACQRIGKPYVWIAYTGDDPLGHVISLNVRRRQMTLGQRALCAARLANIRVGDFVGNQYVDVASENLLTPHISQAQTGGMFDVSERSVTDAAKVLNRGTPDLIQALEDGWFTVSAAVRLLESPPEAQELALAQARGLHEHGQIPPAAGRRRPSQARQPGRPRPQGRRVVTKTEVIRLLVEFRRDCTEEGPNLAKPTIVAKYNTVNQVDRLHGGTKPAHAVRAWEARERLSVT
jgi:ParB-like nuclease domain